METMQDTVKFIEKKKYPKELPLLPLRDVIIYPGMIMPLSIGREKSLKLINSSYEGNKLLALFCQKNLTKDDIEEDDIYKYGTIALIHKVIKAPDDTIKVVVQGLDRIKLKKLVSSDPYWLVNIQKIKEKDTNDDDKEQIEVLLKNIISLFQKAVGLSSYLPQELLLAAMNIEDPEKLSYLIASNLQLKLEEQQEIL
ncbi:MAG: LON peptidase substrate-binding domain-containing protein, partial [Cyanobacteriota bacterium]